MSEKPETKEMKKIATRQAYGEALQKLGEEHKDVVVLDADLANATKTELFKGEFPKRFVDCGIAEGNMVDVAAGLSTVGFVPFVSSFAMFACGRAYDMIRNSIGYPHLNVKICATHGGLSVGEDGASHQMNEDFALMQAIPKLVVMCPADAVEAKKMVEAAYEYYGPVYIRFCRAAAPVFHDEDYEFKIGKAEKLRDGKDITIIANGLMVWEAIQAAEMLAEEGIEADVLNMATIKPLDEEAILESAKKTNHVVTVEEHSVIGGLGSSVASLLSETYPVKVKRIGVEDKFGHSGPAGRLLHEYGLCADNIVKQAKILLDKNTEE